MSYSVVAVNRMTTNDEGNNYNFNEEQYE